MNALENLKKIIPRREATDRIEGQIRTISLCLDPASDEFYNVGMILKTEDIVSVRMLDHFERVRCLYDRRVNETDRAFLLHDIENTLMAAPDPFKVDFGPYIRLSESRYAAGRDANTIIDTFFDSALPLARLRDNAKRIFRYKTTSKLRSDMVKDIKLALGAGADRILQEEPFHVNIKGAKIELEIPFVSPVAASGVASAWYANHLMATNEIFKASSDLHLIGASSDKVESRALSLLRPSADAGLKKDVFGRLNLEIEKHLHKLAVSGIEIIESNDTKDLSEKTAAWWRKFAA